MVIREYSGRRRILTWNNSEFGPRQTVATMKVIPSKETIVSRTLRKSDCLIWESACGGNILLSFRISSNYFTMIL